MKRFHHLYQMFTKREILGASEIAQQVNVLAIQGDVLSSDCKNHPVEGENKLPQVVLQCPQVCHMLPPK